MKDKQKRQIRERFLSFVKVGMSTSLQMCSTESKPHGYWVRAKNRQRGGKKMLYYLFPLAYILKIVRFVDYIRK